MEITPGACRPTRQWIVQLKWQKTGIAAIGITNSSHFGPAGAYTLHAAKKDMIGLAFAIRIVL